MFTFSEKTKKLSEDFIPLTYKVPVMVSYLHEIPFNSNWLIALFAPVAIG